MEHAHVARVRPWPEPKAPLMEHDRLVRNEVLSVTLSATHEGERVETQPQAGSFRYGNSTPPFYPLE
jgi:hypothetical protein